MTELQILRTTLSETHTNIILNSDFTEAFQNRSSLLLSQLGPNASRTTDTKLMLQACEKDLKDLLQDLKKRAEGHRAGWERIKGAFLAKHTRESVENLHRQCQILNNMVCIDTAVLGATTYNQVRETRKEQQEARKEQQDARMDQQKWHQDDKVKELLSWLTTVEYGSQQSDLLSRRQAGTGQWLLGSDEFQTWCNRDSDILFCPGMPGAGKTIMASIVIDYLCTKFRDDKSIAVAYLYCNFRRKDEQKPVDLFASLLQQILLGLPNMPDGVTSLYEYHKRKQTRPSFHEISKELHSIIRNYSKCFIIVDALDECPITDGIRQEFLSELIDLQAKVGANLFATSRFIPQIVKELTGEFTSLEIRASNEDVRKYLDGHMIRLPLFASQNVGLQEEIKIEIVEAVEGMFLLAQLHLESLIDSRSRKALRTALGKLPKGSDAYDRAYGDAMDRIKGQTANSRELAFQTLSWLACAKRPLTTWELQHALAVEKGEYELDEENLSDVEHIVSVCAGLVSVDQESHIIRLVHYTTQEFFERTWTDWFPDTQDDITATCITYLSFDIFGRGFCLSDDEFEARLQLNPLYDYAARNWGYHARDASPGVGQLVLYLFESETKISACSQALMISDFRFPGYSQRMLRGITGVHLAAYFGLTQITELLLKEGFQSDCKATDKQTPLSWAAETGQEAVVKLLVERDDVEADSKDERGQTPLSRAAARGQEAVVKLLVERDDVEADSKDEGGQTPLSWAAARGHEAVVKLLVERDDVEADSKDKDGRSPLAWAAARGHVAILKLLLTKDTVNPNSKDLYGETPVFLAAGNGREVVLGLLLADEAVDLESRDKFGRTPLSWASEKGHFNIVNLLRESYRNKGIVTHDGDLEVASSTTADLDSYIYCNVCLCWIPNTNSHYRCRICNHGGFDICQECFAYGAICFDQSHKLTSE